MYGSCLFILFISSYVVLLFIYFIYIQLYTALVYLFYLIYLQLCIAHVYLFYLYPVMHWSCLFILFNLSLVIH